MTDPIKLYAFQDRGLNAGRASYARGRRAVLFVGPTGMGKTTLAGAAAVGRLRRGGKHIVAIAHRKELVEQLADRLAAMGLDVGARGLRPTAPVQVTSIQTILARRSMPDADFAIIDEAHHYVSDTWLAPVRAYLDHGALVMGLTATPTRDDERGLGHLFDDLIVVAQVGELVALNGREPTKGITPIEVLEPDESVRKLALAPAVAYSRYCPGRSCVVFAPNVKSAHVFVDGFRSTGVDALIVHGELPAAEREEALSRFTAGAVRVLVNVNVLTEGWDAPICDVAMLARKIGSFSLLVQCIGRARRPYPGKASAMLIDLSGNLETHDFHPDNDLEYTLDGIGMTSGDRAGIGPRLCRKCRRVLDDDIAEAKAKGRELLKCPECETKLSRITVPTPEEIALVRKTREEQRAATPVDDRIRALTSLYLKGMREGRKRGSAEFAYKSMFPPHTFPPTAIRVPSWKAATEKHNVEKGAPWLP